MRKNNASDLDIMSIKAYMKLPAIEKLSYLYKNLEFYERFMPQRSKKIWERLKEKGF